MLGNYVVTALRNLARNRLYTLISVGGLAIAFAAALLIAIFVGDEFSYDRWIPGAKDVYRISNNYILRDGRPVVSDSASPQVAGWLKLDFPQIEAAARLDSRVESVSHGRIKAFEPLMWADPDIFTVLPLPTVAGDLKTALDRPDSVVLTLTAARRYFGVDNPIGQTLLIDNRFPVRVTAVIKDLPPNTHLRFSMVGSGQAPFSELYRLDTMANGGPSRPSAVAHTYFRLRPGQSVQPIIDRMPAFIDAHMADQARKRGGALAFLILPIAHIHFAPRALNSLMPRGDLSATLSVATAGVLIVLMAAINFINLMTARAGRRAAEVGVRKAAGAERADLIVQFIGEALVYAALGALIALAIAEISLPGFNAFLGRTTAFPYGVAVPVLLGLALLIGSLAGAYPALVLSSFRPAAALKVGLIQSSGSPAVRQGMVAFQFAVLIGLIVATAVIWRQTVFATRDSLRLDTDRVLLIQAPCVPDGFKTELAALPGVASVACSANAPLFNTTPAKGASFQGREESLFANSVGFGFFELYGLKPLAGRFFSPAYGGDATSALNDRPTRIESVVINESAARAFGFARPADAVGKSFRWSHIKTMDGRYFQVHPVNVIGVVEDFPMNTIRTRIEPTAFYVEPDQSSLINVKLNGRPTPETGKGVEKLARKYGFVGGFNWAFLTPILKSRYLDVRRQGQLFEIFSGLALFIACLGLVGLAAFATEQRTKEVGIRKAMGAGRFDILKLFLWQFTVPVASANLVAWPLAFVFVTRWLQGFAYRIELTVWPFAAAAIMAVCIAWLTVMSLALKAAKARPVNALRYE